MEPLQRGERIAVEDADLEDTIEEAVFVDQAAVGADEQGDVAIVRLRRGRRPIRAASDPGVHLTGILVNTGKAVKW